MPCIRWGAGGDDSATNHYNAIVMSYPPGAGRNVRRLRSVISTWLPFIPPKKNELSVVCTSSSSGTAREGLPG